LPQFAEFETPFEVFRAVFLGMLFLLFCGQVVLGLAYSWQLAHGANAEVGEPVTAADHQAEARRTLVLVSVPATGRDRLFLGHTLHG